MKPTASRGIELQLISNIEIIIYNKLHAGELAFLDLLVVGGCGIEIVDFGCVNRHAVISSNYCAIDSRIPRNM